MFEMNERLFVQSWVYTHHLSVIVGSQGSVAGVVTCRRVDGPEFISRQGQENFSSPKLYVPPLGANPASYSMGTGIYSWDKALGHEVDHFI